MRYTSGGMATNMMAIGFITFALVMAGVAIEAAKGNQSAEATQVFATIKKRASE